jgi:hypothetical protein
MRQSLDKAKSQVPLQKRRVSASKRSRPKAAQAKRTRRPALKELAKEFAKQRIAADDRKLTAFQRRMISGGA